MGTADIRALTNEDRAWIPGMIAEAFGDGTVAAHGTLFHPETLAGFVAERNGEPVGLLTYQIEGDSCEIVTVQTRIERQGIGAALMRRAIDMAVEMGLRRVWLITTNDNTPAQRFYESREFRVVAVHKGAVAEARKLKPAIPLTGFGGVEIRDEIEMEIIVSFFC